MIEQPWTSLPQEVRNYLDVLASCRQLLRLRGSRAFLGEDGQKVSVKKNVTFNLLSPQHKKLASAYEWIEDPDQYDARDAIDSPIENKPPKFWWDIPLLPRAHYEIDVEWGGVESHIQRWTDDRQLNLEPDFQRAHVWTMEQRRAYVEYQLQGGEVGKNITFNHTCWESGMDGDFVIVDGKQRLEAVRSFLRNEFPAFGRLFLQWSGRLRYQAGFKFRITSLSSRHDILRLYLNINAGGTPHTHDEIQKVRNMLESL